MANIFGGRHTVEGAEPFPKGHMDDALDRRAGASLRSWRLGTVRWKKITEPWHDDRHSGVCGNSVSPKRATACFISAPASVPL